MLKISFGRLCRPNFWSKSGEKREIDGPVCNSADRGNFSKFVEVEFGDSAHIAVYSKCLVGPAGGPHYVGFPTGCPSYLFNVSFALVTIQIGPSLFI